MAGALRPAKERRGEVGLIVDANTRGQMSEFSVGGRFSVTNRIHLSDF